MLLEGLPLGNSRAGLCFSSAGLPRQILGLLRIFARIGFWVLILDASSWFLRVRGAQFGLDWTNFGRHPLLLGFTGISQNCHTFLPPYRAILFDSTSGWFIDPFRTSFVFWFLRDSVLKRVDFAKTRGSAKNSARKKMQFPVFRESQFAPQIFANFAIESPRTVLNAERCKLVPPCCFRQKSAV